MSDQLAPHFITVPNAVGCCHVLDSPDTALAHWQTVIDEALGIAEKSKRPVLLDFTAAPT